MSTLEFTDAHRGIYLAVRLSERNDRYGYRADAKAGQINDNFVQEPTYRSKLVATHQALQFIMRTLDGAKPELKTLVTMWVKQTDRSLWGNMTKEEIKKVFDAE